MKSMLYFPLLVWMACLAGCSSGDGEAKTGTAETAPVTKEMAEAEAKESSVAPTVAAQDGWISDDEFGFLDLSYEELQALPLQEFVDKGEYPKAKALVRRLLEEDPDPLNYHYMHGLIQYRQGEYGKAMDEFEYVEKMEAQTQETQFTEKIAKDLENRQSLVDGLLKEMASQNDGNKLALATYRYCKLDLEFVKGQDKARKFRTDFQDAQKRLSINLKRRDYYVIQGMAHYERLMVDDRSFWNFFYHGYFNFVKGWGGDARKSFDRALSVADTQEQVFFALQMLEKIPKKEESELDKLSSLDLSEDMIDEFLAKHSKELNDTQMAKVKEVIREGMKLKDKIEGSKTDREKLNILKEFVEMAEARIDPKDFPPDIVSKVDQMKTKAATRFQELEEQIRIKEEALKG